MSQSPQQSRSTSPDAAATIPIFVKTIAGETITLDVSPTLSISQFTTLLSVRLSLPSSSLRLVHAGKHLSAPSSTLESHNIERDSTIHLTAAPRSSGPKKIRCKATDCGAVAQRIIGHCGFCNKDFCGKHRLLEDHKCDGLEDCKKESHDMNAAKLNSERTAVIKGI